MLRPAGSAPLQYRQLPAAGVLGVDDVAGCGIDGVAPRGGATGLCADGRPNGCVAIGPPDPAIDGRDGSGGVSGGGGGDGVPALPGRGAVGAADVGRSEGAAGAAAGAGAGAVGAGGTDGGNGADGAAVARGGGAAGAGGLGGFVGVDGRDGVVAPVADSRRRTASGAIETCDAA